MPGYEYIALDNAGRTVKGIIEGDAERQVRASLREKGLMPLKLEAIAVQAEHAPAGKVISVRRGMNASDRAMVTRQFATLLRAGLTIEECLNVLIEQTESARARAVVAGVRSKVLEGQSLARALAAFPQSFPDIYRAMVDAGEQSGHLSEVLERLADYSENRQALQQKVVLAFVYPALVFLVAVSAVAALLIFVVPQVTKVFTNTGQTLPWITRALIGMSDFMRGWGLWMLVALIVGVVTAIMSLRSEAVRRRWHRRQLGLPLIGRLVRGVNAARFSDTLGILTASGVPLLAALNSAQQVVTNLPMRDAIEETVRQVREGGSLSRALGRTKLFPPMVVHLIASGEASGKLDTMLVRAGETQSRELENWVKTLTALLEPALILGMGVAVLFIVVAILLPIFQMNQLVK